MKSISKRAVIHVVGMMSLMLLGACGGGGNDVGDSISGLFNVKLQSIEIQADKKSVPAGQSIPIRAIGHFSDGAVTDITSGHSGIGKPVMSLSWSVSNASIANISGSSEVSLATKMPGSVVVTVTDLFSKVTGNLTIDVSAPSPVSLAIDGLVDDSTVSMRTNVQLTAKLAKTDWSTEPAKSVTWSSSNTSVATVDANGNFKGVGPGSVVITATSGNDSKALKLTLLQNTAAPLVTLSCDPSRPTVINAQAWNTQYAIDNINATEWIVVDGKSCQSYPAVELLVPQPKSSSYYDYRFFALRDAGNPMVFQPGIVMGTLSSGGVGVIGQTTQKKTELLGSFSSIYEILIQ